MFPPTSPVAIQAFTKFPPKYETVGLVEASTEEMLFEDGSNAGQRALRELKLQAAELGATAIVLKNYGATSNPDFVLGSDSEISISTNSEIKRITGEAIRTP